jgi:hypothetical protein
MDFNECGQTVYPGFGGSMARVSFQGARSVRAAKGWYGTEPTFMALHKSYASRGPTAEVISLTMAIGTRKPLREVQTPIVPHRQDLFVTGWRDHNLALRLVCSATREPQFRRNVMWTRAFALDHALC